MGGVDDSAPQADAKQPEAASKPREFQEDEATSIPLRLRAHYQALDAAADATEDEVRKLYRKLALRHHPDKNPDNPAVAQERFTAIAEAYEAVREYLTSVERVGVR